MTCTVMRIILVKKSRKIQDKYIDITTSSPVANRMQKTGESAGMTVCKER